VLISRLGMSRGEAAWRHECVGHLLLLVFFVIHVQVADVTHASAASSGAGDPRNNSPRLPRCPLCSASA